MTPIAQSPVDIPFLAKTVRVNATAIIINVTIYGVVQIS